MIADMQEQATCKQCGTPIVVNTRGPKKKAFCSKACKQADYRDRHSNVTMDSETQAYIAEVEQELARSQEQVAMLEATIEATRAKRRSHIDKMDHMSMQKHVLELGMKCGYKPLTL